MTDLHREQMHRAAYTQHAGWLRLRCRAELRGYPPEQIDEAVQECLLTTWRTRSHAPRWAPGHEHPSRGWLAQLARYHCRNLRRKRRDLLTETGSVELADERPAVDQRIAERQRAIALQAATVAVLDERERQVLALRYIEALPSEEIASRFGLASADEVRVILQRCQRRLERALRPR